MSKPHREEGHSKSTVKDVYDEFVCRAADSSLEEAAEKYEVSDEIEVLRELSARRVVVILLLLTSLRGVNKLIYF